MRRMPSCFGVVAMLSGAGIAQAGLVINEVCIDFNPGDPGEFVELVVTADGDYTGYSVIDGGTSVGRGGFQFTGSGFATLRAGTVIVLWTPNNLGNPNTVSDQSYDPDNGDWVIEFNSSSPDTGAFAVEIDTGMNLGSIDECILIGRGSAYALSGGQFTERTKLQAATTYCNPGQFHFGVARNLFTDMTSLDIDLVTSLDIRATGGSWSAEGDFEQGIVSANFTPGAGNTSANQFALLSLRGLAPDDPNLTLADARVVLGPTAPNVAATASLAIGNVATFNNLTVGGSTLSGMDAGDFSITGEPSAITPGGTGNLGLSFTRTAEGFSSATLTLISNDAAGDEPTIQLWGFAASLAPLAGVFITEAQAGPSADSFMELVNTTGAAIDLSGVLVTDEETAQTEGAIRFPAGTTIAAGEVIVLAVGTSNSEPVWLDALGTTSPCTRVFVEPARNSAGWSPTGSVTLIAMQDATGATGTSGAVELQSADGIALLHPAAILSAGGIVPGALTIDGVNWDSTSAGPGVPTSAAGTAEPQGTRAGSGALVDGTSLVRNVPAAANTASNVAFSPTGAPTPGVWNGLSNTCAAVVDWQE